MLKALRRNNTGIKIVLGFLAALFIIWGVGSPVGFSRMDAIAEVHGHPITQRDLDRETAMLQRRFEEMLRGATLPRGIDLRSQALDNLIDEALIRHEADRLGLDVTEDEITAAITTMPELQENGRFNRDLLERVLRVQRDRGEFEDQLRRTLLTQRVQSLVTDGVQVSDAEVADRYRLDHEGVDLAFVKLSAADLGKAVTLSDADLEQYRTAHEDRYRTAPQLKARYVVYKREDFAAQAEPTPEQVQAYYDDNKDVRFTDPEETHARHILVKVPPNADAQARAAAQTKAEGLLFLVRGGGDFADLAKASSDDPGSAANGGDLGFFPRGRMVPEFDAAAFTLEPGTVSEVVETPFGFHIIKVEERKAGGTKPLEAVRDEIVETLRGERALDMARRQADSDRRAVVSGKSLADSVGGRQIHETDPFAAGGDIPGVGRVQAFSDAAFALEPGEVSDIVETDDALYLVQPFERVEPFTPPLAEIRDRVEADARRERGEALAKERADTLRTRAQETGLEKAATEAGLTVDQTGNFERRGATPTKLVVTPDLRTDAFALTAAAPVGPKVYPVGSDVVVIALRERTPADESGLAGAKDALQQSMLQQKKQAALSAYMDHLKERATQEGALSVRSDALGPKSAG